VRSAGLTASRSALMRMTLPAQGQRELAGGFDSQFTPVVEDPALHDSGAPLHAPDPGLGDAAAWPGLLASAIEQAHAAVARTGALDRTVHLSFGDTSGQEYVLQLTADLAIHGWDLARASGQDDALDPDVVALMLPWAEANADLLAASGMFGTRIDTGPGTPDDIRLLGLLGRRA
jgi:uncharacterized protein (TIGR03086 family)